MGRAAVLETAPALELSSADATPPAVPVSPGEVVAEGGSSARPDLAAVDALLSLVQSIARTVNRTLPPVVELEDLVQDGVVGLLECARRYDPGRGVDFRTYASYRIRGAILDGLRARDPLPRSVRRALKVADQRAALGGAGGPGHLPCPVPAVTQLLSLDEAGPLPEEGAEPEEHLLALELAHALRKAVAALPSRDREVLSLRFSRGWRLREVAIHYGISITRVAELQERAVRRLRVALEVPRPTDLSPNGRRRRSRSR